VELIALAEALERAKGKRVNIYTDSHYAFGTIHVHGAIYGERGFRTAEGKNLKNLAEVQRLLMAVEKLKAVAVMYVPGHQSAKTPEAVGNNRADQEAKRAAMVSLSMIAAVDVPVPELPSLPPRPEYSTEDFTWMRAHSPISKGEDGWRSDLEGKLILPKKLGRFLLANLHKSTHLGRRKLLDLFDIHAAPIPEPDHGNLPNCGRLCQLHSHETRTKGGAPYRYSGTGEGPRKKLGSGFY
jgi:hypothetical protein